jgi:hypothetical protein
MADIDKETLATRVLRHLLVVAANEDPDADDLETVADEIDAAIARLSNNGVAPFDVESIPVEAQQQMRDYVAYYCAAGFGVAADRMAMLFSMSETAKTSLADQFENTSIDDDDEETDSNPDYF